MNYDDDGATFAAGVRTIMASKLGKDVKKEFYKMKENRMQS